MISLSKYLRAIVAFGFLLTLFGSCHKENTRINPEAQKQIVGVWKIDGVTRNGVDISQFFDFSAFRITFNDDGSYHLGQGAPFVISKDGSWSLDDGANPLRITFQQQGSGEAFSNEFEYPVVAGSRRIILKGSPGCSSNTYQYSLVAAE